MAGTAGGRWPAVWLLVCAATFAGQLLLGTDLLYAVISLTIFVLFPVVFRLYMRLDCLGGYVLLATFAKLFLISQWLKILFGQAADSHLDAPLETVFVLLLALAAFWLAAIVLWPLLHGRRGGLVRIPQDPAFLGWVAVAAVAGTIASVLVRHLLGLNRVGEGTYEEGRGLVLVLYIGQLMPLAVAALTARAAILSDGRRFLDPLVVAVLLATVLQGVWENQRWVMFSGAMAFVLTYLSYGGRPRLIHGLLVVAAGLLMQMLIFPVIDVQRGLDRDLSPGQFLNETLRIASDMFDREARGIHEDRLEAIYLSWDTRLYYGDPMGFLDRFAPNPLDETIYHLDADGTFGLESLVRQVSYGVPNVVLQPLGIRRPVRAGELIETEVYGHYSNMNYGVLAEIYAHVGRNAFLPAAVAVIAAYVLALHLLYGGVRRNYFAAFGFSTLYFTFAVSDLAEIVPQITIQGVLNLALLAGLGVATGRLRPAAAGHHLPP